MGNDMDFEDEFDNILEFTDEDGNPVKLNVLEKTEIGGVTYMLVTENLEFSFDNVEDEAADDEEDIRFIYKDGEVTRVDNKSQEVDCFILKITDVGEEEASCELVEDEDEVEAITKVFAELMDDAEVDISTDDE